MALERWIQVARGHARDRQKARAEVARASARVFREAVGDYDAFVTTSQDKELALQIGTAGDAAGKMVRLRLSPDDFAAHWLVQGGTGTGKTTFVTSCVDWALSVRRPIGVVDCKSGFFHMVLQSAAAIAWEMNPGDRTTFIERLAIINPFSDALPPLNICRVPSGSTAEVQAYDVTLAFARLFEASLSIHMENILRHLVMLLTEAGLSLVEAPAVLEDDVLRGVLVERSADQRLKEFFFRTYAILPETSKHALTARLQALLLAENVRLMLGADDLIDLSDVISRGDPLLVFLGKGAGIPEEVVALLGSLLLQLLFQAAYASEGKHRPYLVVLDEFFHLLAAPALADRFATALTTLRSFGVHLALVMHNFSQVPPALRETMLANCDLMALFRTSGRNAEFFGDFLPDVDPEMVGSALRRSGEVPSRSEMRRHLMEKLQRLPNRMCYWYDRRKPYRAVQVRVADFVPPHERIGISANRLDAFIREQGIDHGGFAVPREVLRRQLTARKARLRELVRPPIVVVSQEPVPPTRRGRPRLG